MAHHNTSSDVMLVPTERIDRIALFLSKFFSPLFGFIGGYSIAVLAAVQLWGLQPAIVALREQAAALGGSVAQAPAALRQQFGLLHGLSTLAYAIQIGLGIGLVVGLVALKRR